MQSDILFSVSRVWVFEGDTGGKALTCGQGSQCLALSGVCALLPSASLKWPLSYKGEFMPQEGADATIQDPCLFVC